MISVVVFGYVSTVCISIALVPQIIKVLCSWDTASLSLGTYVIADIGNISALIYGIAIHSGPVIATSWLTLGGSVILTVCILVGDYRRRYRTKGTL